MNLVNLLIIFIYYYYYSVITCTPMTVDPKGPLRMNNCSYHYGSKCSFACAVGYQLNGSSTVTCDAPRERPPGAWDNPVPICQGRESCSGGSGPSDKGGGGWGLVVSSRPSDKGGWSRPDLQIMVGGGVVQTFR